MSNKVEEIAREVKELCPLEMQEFKERLYDYGFWLIVPVDIPKMEAYAKASRVLDRMIDTYTGREK